MPAEWEPHEAIWLSWPHDEESYPDLPRVEETFAEIIAAIQDSERVRLFVTGEAMRERAARLMRARGADPERVRFFTADYADIWIRDYGPIFVVDRERGKRAMTHWVFNAWGGKYEELKGDTRVPESILAAMPMPRFRPGVVLEGGAIDVNGRGALLTTEQCLLNPNRNPGLGREEIEGRLRDYLGAEHVVWLKEGIAGDDTDGHVDDIARFVAKDTVVCAWEDDVSDPNHAVLMEDYELLRRATDQDGRPLTIVKLPMPGVVARRDGGRLPASYANFYIGNKTVLVPTFAHANDRRALSILAELFGGRDVVGIDCRALVHGLGTIHCASQQEPSPS
ncbi:MAG: agmatine deiminase family protein [Elusimicrobiota bacterium]